VTDCHLFLLSDRVLCFCSHPSVECNMQCPMDTAASGTSPVMQFHSNADESIAHSSPLATLIQRSQRHCYGDGSPGEFPLAVSPSIVLHVLSSCDLGPKDLANLEASHTTTLTQRFYVLVTDAATDELSLSVLRLHAYFSANLQVLHQTLHCHFRSLRHLICARKGPCLSR
jgi:hypothetical protein